MDLTPIYIFIAVICAVFVVSLMIIDHKPVRIVLLAGILASLGVGVNLHNSIQQNRLDAANQQIITLANCHSDNLDSTQTAEICGWSSK